MIDSELLYRKLRVTVKELRTGMDTKMSQEELGGILGLSRSAVANLETGKQKVSLHNVYTICEYFDLAITDLLPTIEDTRVVREASNNESMENMTPSIELAITKMRENK